MSENKSENKRVTLSFLQKVLAPIVTLINSKASKEELNTKQPAGDYALKSEIPSTEGLATDDYVHEQVNSVKIETDTTLTVAGAAADAKAVGDALEGKQPIGDYALKEDLNVYVQDDEPVDAPDGTVWVDTDAEGIYDVIQSDWNEADETHPAFIKNKPTSLGLDLDEEDAIELVAELGLIDPIISEDGAIYTDIDGKIFSL